MGGAERVVLAMARAFPSAPVYTSFFAPETTFPEFSDLDVRPIARRSWVVRDHVRWALPVMAPAFSRLDLDADVVLCSSAGWAHGANARGRKIVYCHAPARWLYQRERYLRRTSPFTTTALAAIEPLLRTWDQRAASAADTYLTNSTLVRDSVRSIYGIDAEVVPPPAVLGPSGPAEAIPGLRPGFFLCVARLLPYKNVDAVVQAFALLPDHELVVVGVGPEAHYLRSLRLPNVRIVGRVPDARLRWLYANCVGVVAGAFEDYGLTPLEAARFGKPSAVLRWGGYLDTVIDGETGLFFDEPTAEAIAETARALAKETFSAVALRRQSQRFSLQRFVTRLREIVESPGTGHHTMDSRVARTAEA